MRVTGKNVFNELNVKDIRKIYLSKHFKDKNILDIIHKNNLKYVLTEQKILDGMIKNNQGIVVDINRPDYDMRFRLAKKKAEVLGLQCSDDIFEYIAKNITTTNRDIEGAIKKLLVHQKFINSNITIDIVKTILKDTLNANKKIITIDKIQQKVADFYKITKTELLSDRRDRKFSLPRQIAFYLSKKITQKSFPEIGREFGNKNHATVIFAYNKIIKEVEKNTEILSNITEIEKLLKA